MRARWIGSALGLLGLVLATASPPGVAAAPSFSVTAASVTPNPVTPGTQATVTIGVTNAGTLASGIIVDMEIYDAANRKVLQQYVSGQTFAAGESRTYEWSWDVPGDAAGTYTVKVGVFGDGWSPLHVWNNGATTVDVQSGPALPVAFSIGTISAAPSVAARGGSVTITASITNTGEGQASGIIVMLYLRDALGNEFPGNQQVVDGQSFGPGEARSYSFRWTAPSNAAQGVYSAGIGVFNASWSELYAWEQNDSAFRVGTAGEPAFAVGTTTVAPNPVAPGGSFTITTEVTNTSQVAASGIIVLAEYNDPARNIDQQFVSGLTFASGQRRTLSFVFQVPATLPPGPYTVDVGVFNGTWSKLYVWGFEIEDFTVR
jgi:hypothetical protein